MPAALDNQVFSLLSPERLIAETRSEFRAAALEHLEHLRPDVGALVIDMRRTLDVDASGLGILVLVQKRAKEKGLSTRLDHAPERVRNLLKLTLIYFLFELTD